MSLALRGLNGSNLPASSAVASINSALDHRGTKPTKQEGVCSFQTTGDPYQLSRKDFAIFKPQRNHMPA
eukprot:1162097-Pelagomonas_calceolata.AAC.5